jgi:hypothetical protein
VVVFFPNLSLARVFLVSSGDVAGLIAAMNAANSAGGENTIILEPGQYILRTVDNGSIFSPTGPNGLPVIAAHLILQGAGADLTTLSRDPMSPIFRVLFVSSTGNLELRGITITGGMANFTSEIFGGGGAGIANVGTANITSSKIFMNQSTFFAGAGIYNSGTMLISNTTVNGNRAANTSGGGIANQGNMTISASTISNNLAVEGDGAGIFNSRAMTIVNTTIGQNQGTDGTGGGIDNFGSLSIIGSTIAENLVNVSGIAVNQLGGISNPQGLVQLQNTVVARNTTSGNILHPTPFNTDCGGSGVFNSLGHNLIGDSTGCSITVQPTDLIGDPHLSSFVDSGAPGNGRFELVAGSPLIDSGNAASCSATDQLGAPRRGGCDIGAIEFYPIINGMVDFQVLNTSFDPSPFPGAPSGTLLITARLVNTSNQAMAYPFAQVQELSGGNVLLNAEGGPGGVGARLTPPGNASTDLKPGASSVFQFLLGIQQPQPLTFFVNVLGSPVQ